MKPQVRHLPWPAGWDVQSLCSPDSGLHLARPQGTWHTECKHNDKSPNCPASCLRRGRGCSVPLTCAEGSHGAHLAELEEEYMICPGKCSIRPKKAFAFH